MSSAGGEPTLDLSVCGCRSRQLTPAAPGRSPAAPRSVIGDRGHAVRAAVRVRDHLHERSGNLAHLTGAVDSREHRHAFCGDNLAQPG
ncbi:MAG: hypothetical protein M3Y33_15710 [Actinomycetota bacterium]|nr:hypothetical protein [Actinomycetota bacterium]